MRVKMPAIRLPLKAVSTNQLYVGKKIKSRLARQFEADVAVLLKANAPDITLPDGDLTLHLRFGITRRSDVSNCVKLLEDCIARHYGINDRRFAGLTMVRQHVKPGQEFIVFEIDAFRPDDFPSLIGRI